MRLLIRFAKEFQHDDIEKDVDANDSVDNLSLLISLTIPEFNTYDLCYRGTRLTNAKATLGSIIDANQAIHEVRVVKKGAGSLLLGQATAFKDNLTNNLNLEGAGTVGSKLLPVLIALILVVVVFSLLG